MRLQDMEDTCTAASKLTCAGVKGGVCSPYKKRKLRLPSVPRGREVTSASPIQEQRSGTKTYSSRKVS